MTTQPLDQPDGAHAAITTTLDPKECKTIDKWMADVHPTEVVWGYAGHRKQEAMTFADFVEIYSHDLGIDRD
jgi:uncharacterized protein YeaO (DUF488 family)